MKKAVNYVRGSVCARIECPYPERFVNVCAQNEIEFWRLTRVSETTVTVFLHIGGYRKLCMLAERAGFSVKPVKKVGAPFFFFRLRKRYMLLLGMLISLFILRVMTLFVWEIEVYGNTNVPTQLILDTLSDYGVKIGTFGPSIVSESVANDMILEIPELSWLAINVRGSHADVLVRERIPKPEIVDESKPMMVTAEKSGVIVKMSVLEGLRQYTIGDTVEKGEILVTGVLDSKSSGVRTVHAMAEVYARTWYELSAAMPAQTIIKDYTGKTKTRRYALISGKTIKILPGASIEWEYYDKIRNESVLRLPTGNSLPVTFITETYAEYLPQSAKLSVSDIEKILQPRLMAELKSEVGDGEIAEYSYETVISNGVVTVTIRAECIEEISGSREFTDDEFAQIQNTADQ